ncbi:MAG: hypothetical protein B7Y61_02835 [Rhizobiales bacterium 35-66-30]|nr:MAG: hypothetical protein B7Y61_02835 [Rhizobiales bacterium 35-66-30]
MRQGDDAPLQVAPDARELLIRFSDAVESAQAPGGAFAEVTAYASKAAEQAARVAGVLSLWGNLYAPVVNADTMANGIELAQFYLSEASRLSDAALVSQEIERAEALRRWLVTKCEHDEIVTRDVLRGAPSRELRESPMARAALAVLEKHGWIVPLEPGTVVRGAARKEAWRIVRQAHVV